MRYTPASVVVTGYSTPVSTLTATTFAFATTAPEGSETVPFSVPRSPWANKPVPNAKTTVAFSSFECSPSLFLLHPEALLEMTVHPRVTPVNRGALTGAGGRLVATEKMYRIAH